LTGCASGKLIAGCAGLEYLTPNEGTKDYIAVNDKKFTRQVIAHNEFLTAQKCP
jgi:hypothetical protein